MRILIVWIIETD